MYDDSEDFAPGTPSQSPSGTGQRKVVNMPSSEKNVDLGRGGASPPGEQPPGSPPSGAFDPYASPYDQATNFGGATPPPPPAAAEEPAARDYEASPDFSQPPPPPAPQADPYAGGGSADVTGGAIPAQPEITSDPKYQQLSLGAPAGAQPPPPPPVDQTGYGAPPPAEAPVYKPPSVADLKDGTLTPAASGGAPYNPMGGGGGSSDTNFGGQMAPMQPAYGGSGDYNQQPGSSYLGGDEGPVDKDGVPRYVPPLPDSYDDQGTLGRKYAGVAWLIAGFLFVLGTILQGGVGTGLCGTGPYLLGGALMLTGKRWAGIIGLVFMTLISLASFGLAALVLTGSEFFDRIGIPVGGLIPLGIAIAAYGAFFVVSNLMMLVGAPGKGRALAGVLLMILSQVGMSVFLHTMPDATVGVSNPTGPVEAQRVQNRNPNFSFTKPADWATYNWDMVSAAGMAGKNGFALSSEIVTRPRFHYINKSQDMMVAFYLADKPTNLIQLFGAEKMTDIEKEFTRELPTVGEPDSFIWPTDSEVVWRETIHEGRLESGPKLRVIVDRTDLGEAGFLYIVLTANAERTIDQESIDKAMNGFFEELVFK